MPTKNQSPADGAEITRMARRSEQMHGFLTGTEVRNPRGLKGADLSGAPYGTRLDTSIAGFGGIVVGGGGWSRGLEGDLPITLRGRIWVKPGTSYTTIFLGLLVIGTGTSGTVSGTINGTTISEANTGSASGEILSAVAEIPTEAGWNDVVIRLDSTGALKLTGLSLR